MSVLTSVNFTHIHEKFTIYRKNAPAPSSDHPILSHHRRRSHLNRNGVGLERVNLSLLFNINLDCISVDFIFVLNFEFAICLNFYSTLLGVGKQSGRQDVRTSRRQDS